MPVLEKNDLWIPDTSDANYPDAPTERALDLNVGEDYGCAPGFFLWSNPSFGEDALTTVDLSSYGRDGSKRAGKGRDDRVLRFVLGYNLDKTLSDQEAMELCIADLALLGELLDQERMLAWQLKWLTEPVFYDYKDSPIPELLRGGADSLPIFLDAKAAPDGLPIDLTVHPWPRLAKRTIEAGTVHNAVGDRTLILTNPGNRDSEFKLELDVDGGNVAGYEIAFRTEGNLTEWATHVQQGAPDWTKIGAGTSLVSAVMVVDFSGSSEEMQRRFRMPTVAVDPTSIEGVHLPKLRIRPRGVSVASEFRLQARWGFSGDDYSQESGPIITLKARDFITTDWLEVELPLITVPKGAKRIDIDIYLSREEGDGKLDFHQRILNPASVWNFGAYTSGLMDGNWDHERFDAEFLVGTGAMKFGQFRLNENTEYARTKPGSGFFGGGLAWPAGVHAFALHGSAREPTDDATDIAVFEMVDAATGVTRDYISIRTTKDRRTTFFGKRPLKRARFYSEVTLGDVSGGKKFFLRATESASTADGRRLDISAFVHSFLRAATADTPMVLDTFERRTYVRNAVGTVLFPLVPENEWPLLPPNTFGMVTSIYDAPPEPGYDDFDSREPLPISETSRAATLSLEVWPRRIGMG